MLEMWDLSNGCEEVGGGAISQDKLREADVGGENNVATISVPGNQFQEDFFSCGSDAFEKDGICGASDSGCVDVWGIAPARRA
jgi:hypothetical protein